MNRLFDKLKVFKAFTDDLATLTTCKRGKVGAIVVPDDFTEVYSIGYNGQPTGLSNERCTGEQGKCGCVHAEANAIIKLGKHYGPLILLSSTSPCPTCAGLIINKRLIKRVIYWNEYRDLSGLERLTEAGIPTRHITELNDDNIRQWWPSCY